jgi:hypothetical protein
MQTIEAIYDKGKLIFLGEDLNIRAKVKLTVLEVLPKEKKKRNFPEINLGKVRNISRKELYGEYLSAWH